ncbi:hypothetical protein [Aquibacillus rhizosphaerae]|uniref:Uncharacterized protein n=1 Tax=Aquibacillus rhizosphaerae TaxID=3051431 RepID=A0ABT7LA77_9BACI|nr:hypothetical protein [Aquibacillus sp. LR5S19]MDL4842299.1 hypothetical protein [Aquibacillus sp. LR5S19]
MSFRGDAHKFYLKLNRNRKKENSIKHIRELKEVQDIRTFYNSIDTYTLKLIYYRMIKEKSGSGIIPLFVTAVPWFLFLFSKQIQEFLFQEGSLLWILFSFIYMFTLAISVIVHFREKAWAVLHIEILLDLIGDRNE